MEPRQCGGSYRVSHRDSVLLNQPYLGSRQAQQHEFVGPGCPPATGPLPALGVKMG